MSEKRNRNNVHIQVQYKVGGGNIQAKVRSANWTAEKVAERRVRNLATQRRRCAKETAPQAAARRGRNLASHRSRIHEETVEQTEERRARDLAAKRQRLTVETEEQADERRARNLAAQRRKRQREKLHRKYPIATIGRSVHKERKRKICLDAREIDDDRNIISSSDSQDDVKLIQSLPNGFKFPQPITSVHRMVTRQHVASFSEGDSSSPSELNLVKTQRKRSHGTLHLRNHNFANVIGSCSNGGEDVGCGGGVESRFDKFKAFGEFLASSLIDMNEKDSLRLIEKFTVELNMVLIHNLSNPSTSIV